VPRRLKNVKLINKAALIERRQWGDKLRLSGVFARIMIYIQRRKKAWGPAFEDESAAKIINFADIIKGKRKPQLVLTKPWNYIKEYSNILKGKFINRAKPDYPALEIYFWVWLFYAIFIKGQAHILYERSIFFKLCHHLNKILGHLKNIIAQDFPHLYWQNTEHLYL
jgi:hypothetical protein